MRIHEKITILLALLVLQNLVFASNGSENAFAQRKNKIVGKCYIIDGPANVREKPKSQIVGSVKNFEIVKVIQKEGDWFLISKPIGVTGSNYKVGIKCLSSNALIPIGWTHKSNLKFYPDPLIRKTNLGIKLLGINKIVLDSKSEEEVGIESLSIGFFIDSKIKNHYWGGLVIDRGYMDGSEAYLFNDKDIVEVEYKGNYIKLTDKGFVYIQRGPQSDDGSCEVATMLILPNKVSKVIKTEVKDARVCGAG